MVCRDLNEKTAAAWEWLLSPGTAVVQALERAVAVFEGGNTRVLLFCLLVGGLIELMRVSGGVKGFVASLSRRGLGKTPRQAGILTMMVGVLVWMETSMSCLAAGMVGMPLFDRFKLSRERLAFILDSTCAPISVIILFNGWGGYVLGLISEDSYQIASPVNVLVGSIGFNFYALLILGLVAFTVISGRTFGPLRRAEAELAVREESAEAVADRLGQDEIAVGKTRYMLLPLAIMVVLMIVFLIQTGSGSRSVLWSVSIALVVTVVYMVRDGAFSYPRALELGYQGMGKLLPLVLLMLLAFTIGKSCRELGTGVFVAGWIGTTLPAVAIAPLLFLAGALMSFTTGTSWGTFAILIPVGMPLAATFGLPHSLFLAAILGGGVFGDHCSPISDTTLVASLAAGCDLLDHVRTQLPYALVAGGGALILYTLAGLVLQAG
nr:Na+/H+ antiporter NhaC family protein [Acanthopleuribacter pedis]